MLRIATPRDDSGKQIAETKGGGDEEMGCRKVYREMEERFTVVFFNAMVIISFFYYLYYNK